jgi:hypothetical protein
MGNLVETHDRLNQVGRPPATVESHAQWGGHRQLSISLRQPFADVAHVGQTHPTKIMSEMHSGRQTAVRICG